MGRWLVLVDLDDLLDTVDILLIAALAVTVAPGAEFGRGDDLEDHARQAGAANQKVRNTGRCALLIERHGAAADLKLAEVVVEAATER